VSISDRRKARSKPVLIHYEKGESGRHRHDRRLAVNLKHKKLLQDWCDSVGLELKITNRNHHWRIYGKEPRQVFEWWPVSAKFIVNQNYDSGIHVHDIYQVIEEIKHARKR
jgi:hypothetical protein